MISTGRTQAQIVLASTLMLAGCGKQDSPTVGANAEIAAVRAKMQAMSPKDLQVYISESVGRALAVISGGSSLSNFVNSVFQSSTQRVRFELTANAVADAKRIGISDFQGDAFTVTGETRKAGEPSRFVHVIYLQDSVFVSTGKLVVVLAHELFHIKRREEGVAVSSYREEEAVVFGAGIGFAEGLVRDGKVDPTVAREIELALAVERRLLATWARRPR